MNEPSVLDYVKAKLTFWKKVDISLPETVVEPAPAAEPANRTISLEGFLRVPWLLLLPFGLAITAQMLLEPPDQKLIPASALYVVSAVTAIGAAMLGKVKLAEAQPDASLVDDMRLRRLFAIVGFIALVLAFILMGGNRFDELNLTVWLFSLVTFVIAFLRDWSWEPVVNGLRRIGAWLKYPAIRFSLSPWVVLVVAVCAVLLYFRFSNLYQIPLDMVSDQAEKLYDVNDVLNGQHKIFFERNTGREPFQFYWTALMAIVFNTGISYMSLKIGTVIAGLITLFFIYKLGNEVGGRWVALYALFFAGIAYWANIISRIGLRFPLYPFCVAPVLFYLIRGLRTNHRNDFIWAGLWLGIGLHGYTASRVVPGLVIVAVLLYVLHRQSVGNRKQALILGALLLFIAFAVFIPLFRYALDNPEMFNYRSFTRISDIERQVEGNVILIFLNNTWNALRMFFLNNGDVWVHSVPLRPALDVISAAFFFVGVILLLVRYFRRWHWRDAFLIVSIPILLLPSIMSIAFPNENPNLNRTAGAYVPVFVVVGLGFDAFLRSLAAQTNRKAGLQAAVVIGLVLAALSTLQNHRLFFKQYQDQYNLSAWNTTEMGQVMYDFSQSIGSPDTTYVVGYPYWVDTRLVGINAGYVDVNPEIFRESIAGTTADPRAKLFMVNPIDVETIQVLNDVFPNGWMKMHDSPTEGKDFIVFVAPAQEDYLP